MNKADLQILQWRARNILLAYKDRQLTPDLLREISFKFGNFMRANGFKPEEIDYITDANTGTLEIHGNTKNMRLILLVLLEL